MFLLLAILVSFAGAPTYAAPTMTLSPRGASQCGQYTSISTRSYALYANKWGASTGSGTQCSHINSLICNTLAWSTSWTWANSPNSVKSYTNVEVPIISKPLSRYKSLRTSWTYSYTGTNVVANVAYDMFLGTSATLGIGK